MVDGKQRASDVDRVRQIIGARHMRAIEAKIDRPHQTKAIGVPLEGRQLATRQDQ